MTAREEFPGLSREELAAMLNRERGVAPRDGLAIVDAGLPLHLGRGLRGGFDSQEVRVVMAARQTLRAAAAEAGGGGRVAHGNEVLAAARQVRELLGGKGCPGPKQVTLVQAALLRLEDDGVTLTPEDPLERVCATRDEMLAFATKRADKGSLSRDTLDEMKVIHEECGGDAFCRGRQLAAMLVALHDVEGRVVA